MGVAIEVFLGLVERIAPGKTLAELLEEYERSTEASAATPSGVIVHTNGCCSLLSQPISQAGCLSI